MARAAGSFSRRNFDRKLCSGFPNRTNVRIPARRRQSHPDKIIVDIRFDAILVVPRGISLHIPAVLKKKLIRPKPLRYIRDRLVIECVSWVAAPIRLTSLAVSIARSAATSTPRAISWVAVPCLLTAAATALQTLPISRISAFASPATTAKPAAFDNGPEAAIVRLMR